jgi:hypothetical protein
LVEDISERQYGGLAPTGPWLADQVSSPKPPRAERIPAIGDFHPQQLVLGNCVLCERRLIGEARRALGGDHTRSGTASYTFGSDESGNLRVAIVVRHDLSLLAG